MPLPNARGAAEQSLDPERPRYEELFRLAPCGYLVTDSELRITDANDAAGDSSGASRCR